MKQDELAAIYSQIISEGKKEDLTKGTKIPGAVPVGTGITGDQTIPKDAGGPAEKIEGVNKKIDDNKKRSSDASGKHGIETVGAKAIARGESMENEFDKLFNSVVSEAEDPLDAVITDETGEIPGEEGDIEPEMGAEEEESDLIGRLKAVRDELDAIITDSEGVEEEEEGEMGIPPAEGEEIPAGESTTSSRVALEAGDLNTRPTPLKTKGENLQKGTEVAGSKIKASGSAARMPASKTVEGRPTALGKKQVPNPDKVSDGPMGQGKDADFIK